MKIASNSNLLLQGQPQHYTHKWIYIYTALSHSQSTLELQVDYQGDWVMCRVINLWDDTSLWQ